jgi:hypothetical protein
MNEQLLRAIHSAYGDSHFIVCFVPQPLQRCFPRGVHTYMVEHEISTCAHLPRCHWLTPVYEYRGHYTAVRVTDLAQMTVGDLVDRVTRAIEN